MDDDSQPYMKVFADLLETLNEAELSMLKRLIEDRVNLIRAQRSEQGTAEFGVGDRVSFKSQGKRTAAKVLRVNKKTLGLLTDGGERRNVARQRCKIIAPVVGDLFDHEMPEDVSNVITLPTATQQPQAGRWLGGIVEMPAYVAAAQGATYRPFIVMWVNEDELVIGTEICSPDDDLADQALACLKRAMHTPLVGAPQRPTHITVNDAKLADFLSARLPNISFVHGATPLLADIIEDIDSMMPDGDAPDSYLATGLTGDEIADFFSAAATLYRSGPWEHIPHDSCLLSLTIESLGISDAAVSVIGHLGESFGVLVYADLQDYCRYHIASDSVSRGVEPDLPSYIALSFDEGADVSEVIRKEIAAHGWEVVNTSSYPVLFTPDRDKLLRPVEARDIALFEALSRAVIAILEDSRKLTIAWNGGKHYRRSVTVDCIGDPTEVAIVAPYPFERVYAARDNSDSILTQMAQLAHTAGDPDPDAYNELCELLLVVFFTSAEGAKRQDGPSIIEPLLQFTFMYQGSTIATLQAGALEEIVFDLMPRKVVVPYRYEKSIIVECRLFYRFLKRHYALPQADACLKVLGGNAINRLKKAFLLA